MRKLLIILFLISSAALAAEPLYMVLWIKKGSPADNDAQMYSLLEPYMGPHETVYTSTNEQGGVTSTTNINWTLNYVDYTNSAGVAYNVACFSNGIRDEGNGAKWYGWMRESNGKSPVGQGALNGIINGQNPNKQGDLTDNPQGTLASNGLFAAQSPAP